MNPLAPGHVSMALRLAAGSAVNVKVSVAQCLLHGLLTGARVRLHSLEKKRVPRRRVGACS